MDEIKHYLSIDGSSKTGLVWRVSPKGRGVVGAAAGSKRTERNDKYGCYWQVMLKKKLYLAHRVVWYLHHGEWPSGEIDHINGDTTDNRVSNLRDVTKSVNIKNKAKQSNNKSGFTGVYFETASGKYRAQIKSNGVIKNLGRFERIEDAVIARRAAEVLDGEFTERHGKEKR